MQGLPFISMRNLFLLEIALCLVCLYKLLSKYVSACFRRLLHADALDHALGTGLCCECCDGFLCHNLISSKLFDFLVDGNFLQEGIVLLALKTLGSVLLVLGSDVAGNTRNTAGLLLSALEDDLHPASF